MRLGLALPHYPFSFPTESADEAVATRALRYARLAEEFQLDQIWVSDHFWINISPTQTVEQRQYPAECWALLSAIAAQTSRVRIGSLVTPAGFHNPHVLARTVATVDAIAGGRLDVGLGAGWNQAEYAEHGLEFGSPQQRLAGLASAIEILRGQTGAPPIWVGGKRPLLLALAAAADGWNTAWDCHPDEYRRRATIVDDACRRRGRDPRTLRRSVGLTTLIGRDAEDLETRWHSLQRWAPAGALNGVELREWATTRLVGTPAEIVGQLRHWLTLGVEQVICALGAPFAVYDDAQLDLLAKLR